jgi:hypothetical protein
MCLSPSPQLVRLPLCEIPSSYLDCQSCRLDWRGRFVPRNKRLIPIAIKKHFVTRARYTKTVASVSTKMHSLDEKDRIWRLVLQKYHSLTNPRLQYRQPAHNQNNANPQIATQPPRSSAIDCVRTYPQSGRRSARRDDGADQRPHKQKSEATITTRV